MSGRERLGISLSIADAGGGASQSAATTFSAQCRRVRVSGNKSYYVRIGDGAQTAVIGDTLVPANIIDYFTVTPGQTESGVPLITSSVPPAFQFK